MRVQLAAGGGKAYWRGEELVVISDYDTDISEREEEKEKEEDEEENSGQEFEG